MLNRCLELSEIVFHPRHLASFHRADPRSPSWRSHGAFSAPRSETKRSFSDRSPKWPVRDGARPRDNPPRVRRSACGRRDDETRRDPRYSAKHYPRRDATLHRPSSSTSSSSSSSFRKRLRRGQRVRTTVMRIRARGRSIAIDPYKRGRRIGGSWIRRRARGSTMIDI